MSFFQKITASLFRPFADTPAEGEGTDSRLEEYEQIFALARKKFLTPEKKAELESLYAQLLTKSDNVASGQLQFLGLDKIKEKMGEKWPRLQSLVHKTAEEVIHKYVTSHDIYFLYKEDRFVIIFTQSTIDEINDKVAMISNEIMQRLADLDEEELKTLEIKQEVKKLEVGSFLDDEFPDMLDYIFRQYNPLDTKPINAIVPDIQNMPLDYAYRPLWHTGKNLLNGFLCLAREQGDERGDFEAYKSLFNGRPLAEKAVLDIRLLEKIIADFEAQHSRNKKLYLLCPVQHETVYNFNSYEEYRTVCQKIPANLRQYLMFFVTNSQNYSMPAKDTYWFIGLLQNYCAGIFVDLPMKETVSFHHLKHSGADAVGVLIKNAAAKESANLDILSGFHTKATNLKIPHSFAFDIQNETIAKSLVGMGFTYLSGPAICDSLPLPDRDVVSPLADALRR